MKCYLIANNEMRLDVWTRQRREINKFQRMMQPPSPPAFLCHSFAPSNEVVNGSFDAESFSTKSRIDSHASLLVLAALHSCVSLFFDRKMIENAGLNVSEKEKHDDSFKGTYLQLFGESLCFVFEFV